MSASWPQLFGTSLQSLLAPLPQQVFAIYDHQNPGRILFVIADGAGNLTVLPQTSQPPCGLQQPPSLHAWFQPTSCQPDVSDARVSAGLHNHRAPFPLPSEVERPVHGRCPCTARDGHRLSGGGSCGGREQ